MILYHRVNVFLVEVGVVQVLHLRLFFRQIDALLFRDRHQLGVRFAVIGHHRAADFFDVRAFALLFRHLAHVDFHHAALGRLSHEGFVFCAERSRCRTFGRAGGRLLSLFLVFLFGGLSGNAEAKPGPDESHDCDS